MSIINNSDKININEVDSEIKIRKRKKMTEETKLKISLSQKNLSREKRERINYGIRNNRYTKEYAKKLSDTKLGETNPQAKLTEEKVILIKQLWKTGRYTTTTLGEKFNMSRQSINDIVRNRTWKHINIEDDEIK